MKLGYVCTNFNNSHFTVGAVRSLVASAGNAHQLRIVIVDNQSTQKHVNTLRELADEFPGVVDLLINTQNVGYFKGLNCGIRRIQERYPEVRHLVIGNNDLLFPMDFCLRVEKSIPVLDKYAVVSPDIVTLDGEHQNPHVIQNISKTRELVYDLYYSSFIAAQVILWIAKVSRSFTDRRDEKEHRTPQFIYQGHGSCYLIGPKFFSVFTELWAPTFLMGEEFFLSKQLADKEMKVFYTPAIQLTHCCHGSLAALPSRKAWEFSRAAHQVYRRYVRTIGW